MMRDESPSMMEYLLTLTPEEAAAAVEAMPKAEKLKLVSGVCGAVRAMSSAMVRQADEMWEKRWLDDHQMP